MQAWRNLVEEWIQEENQLDIIRIMALNKVDLSESIIKKEKSIEDTPLKWVAEKEMPVLLTSARNGQGVEDLFSLLRNLIVQNYN